MNSTQAFQALSATALYLIAIFFLGRAVIESSKAKGYEWVGSLFVAIVVGTAGTMALLYALGISL